MSLEADVSVSSKEPDNYGKQCRNFICLDSGDLRSRERFARPTCCSQTENADFEAQTASSGQTARATLFCQLLIYLCCECHQIFLPDYIAKRHCLQQLYGTLSEQIFNQTSSRLYRGNLCFYPGKRKLGGGVLVFCYLGDALLIKRCFLQLLP